MTATTPPIAILHEPIRERKRRKPAIPPGLLRRKQAARFLGISLPTLDRWHASGLLPSPIRLGGSTCWARRELQRWCDFGCPDRKAWSELWKSLRLKK